MALVVCAVHSLQERATRLPRQDPRSQNPHLLDIQPHWKTDQIGRYKWAGLIVIYDRQMVELYPLIEPCRPSGPSSLRIRRRTASPSLGIVPSDRTPLSASATATAMLSLCTSRPTNRVP